MTINLMPASIIGETFSLLECVEKFDQGADNLYVVDNNGNYTGNALPAFNMRKLWYKDAASCILQIPAIPQEILESKAGEFFQHYPQFTGFPIVNESKIVGAVSVIKSQVGKYKWDSLFDPFWQDVKFFVDETVKIYLSSLEHEDIYNFYRKFANRLPMTPISPDNIEEVLKGENGALLVYGIDIFPEMPKISIHEIWQECYKRTIERDSNLVHIYKDVAKVNVNEADGLAKYIRHFDNGHHTVAIVDDNDNFVSVAALSTMRNYFPKKDFPKWNNLYLDYTDDQEALKVAMAEACFGSARRELPIVKDRKIVATGLWIKRGERFNINGEAKNEVIEIKWNIISDDVAKTILNNRKRILLSSSNGFLNGFVERFGKIFDVDVFDDSLRDKYIKGEYDFLIYEADIWNISSITKYSVVKLYCDMLAEEVRRYLVKNNISYYFALITDVPKNIAQRLKNHSHISPPANKGGEYFDYYIQTDMNTKEYNAVDGKRITVDQPEKYESTVYFFGPCTNIGVFVSDKDTISSRFQSIMNKNNYMVRAVNCGQGCLGDQTTEINTFYRMMDMNFKEGDIIIHLGTHGWEALPNDNADLYINMKQFFDMYNNQYDKVFIDGMPHLLPEGNQIVAEGLFEKIKDKLPKEIIGNRKNVPAMFKTLIDANILPPPQKTFRFRTIPIKNIKKARRLPEYRRNSYELQSFYERAYASCKFRIA